MRASYHFGGYWMILRSLVLAPVVMAGLATTVGLAQTQTPTPIGSAFPSAAGRAQAISSRPPLTYRAAVERAMTANPLIAAARLRRSVNLAARDVAAERLNPEFRVEWARETPKEGYTLAVPW